jgi:hypothetical protein
MTCLWPLLWQTSRDVWPEQDNFPSVVTANQPFNKTLSSEMFRMMSPLQGGSVVESVSSQKDVVQLAVDCGEHALFYLINKNHKRRKVTVEWPSIQPKAASGRQISTKLQAPFDTPVELKDGQLSFFAEPNSFTVIQIQK